ncbi:FeS assembly protein SufD [Spiroplasma gladiatoris]|uniref:FeS assembly protein SufD n=1 Tax=Spiroplasma gladiatoris TaxID=2143 RepID=A0A4P7AHR0_9MOLU|nr:SufD family Fe-S cluster assembly protein [Spiroplasma gladiatoris]QBQ07985.1 FeS assembly protein SufD [Spiroplasma gladiatoris]
MINFSNENIINFFDSQQNLYEFKNDAKNIMIFGNINSDLSINISKNLNIDLTILFLQSSNLEEKTFNITFNVESYSSLNLKIANFANFNCNDNITVKLLSENSNVNIYSSTILNENLNKNSIVKVDHISRNTLSNIKLYEILKGHSKGFIRCISDIKNKSSNSEAHQELRLLVLDEHAKANSDPVLLIDENDIVASHANAIGMLDQDQMFYLLSRGLKKSVAEELIVNGFFEPIFIEIEDEQIVKQLKEMLKGML